MTLNGDITFIGRTTARNRRQVFGIRDADRLAHMYIIGKTGTGKSTLIEGMVRQDIAGGKGLALVDPHGDVVERVAASVPARRRRDLVYLNAPDPAQPYGYNPLRRVRADKIPLAASGLLEVLKKMWGDAWGVRMEHILRNALYALLERRDATLPAILRLLNDKRFRMEVTRSIRNPQVQAFWESEFPGYSRLMRSDGIAPVQNKVGAFLADPTLRRILTEPKQPIRFRKVMDEGGILLVNLSKGQLGEDSAALLGGLIVTTIGLAAFTRADLAPDLRRPFHLYVDEFQSFTTLSLVNMASELRKYGIGLVLAHQYLHQLEPEIRHAVLGNAGTIASFRTGPEDAPLLARQFYPRVESRDLLSLPNYQMYLRLMIDGTPSLPFSAESLPLPHPMT